AVSRSQTQRWLALGLFLLTLAVAGVAVHLTIRRSIRNPLTQLTGRLKTSSQQISIASQQLSGASDLLARNANEQAAALEEASASSEEANAMARSNAQNAGQARHLMQESAQNFDAIHAAHSQLVSAMEEIGQSSSKIGRIIKAIDEIAFQTNILALNAAVEAARAGEAGRGFAVVADEVRSLAQRSANAARETADLIEESAGRAGAGQERLEAVTRLLATNSEIAGKVNALVEEITRASEEQARGIDEISRTVQITSKGTHQTAAGAAEGAASVQSMSSQVQELNDVVDRLQAMVGA
ncbi:MAG: methyl-accepting chemotaxis protein, partial [Bryobacter sp.]|nr:methyl-accepting chemotaxis protein [Bryobacter sp.]